MINEYKIYKAKVTKVTVPDDEGEVQRKIYVSQLHHTGSGPWEKEATPPSWMPTDTLGSGVVSFPSVGQECLVAEYEGNRHILAYTPPRGVSPYGMLIPERIEEGAVLFSVKGIDNASIKLNKYGYVGLYSNTFAQSYVDGSKKLVFHKGYNVKQEYAGGYSHALYNKEEKSTPYTQVFTRFKDNPGFDDTRLRTEQTYENPLPPVTPPYTYKDKAIVRAGYIDGESVPYLIETRQAHNQLNPWDKNVITKLRLGYQLEHNRFGDVTYEEGSVLEWGAKKNIRSNMGVYSLRVGKLRDSGESYRFMLKEGNNNNIPYGKPITNPLGEGQGWEYEPNSTAKEYWSDSFGLLSQGDQKGTLYRRHMSGKYTQTDFLRYQEILGAQGAATLFKQEINYGEEEKKYLWMSFTEGTADFKEILQGSDNAYNKQIFNSAGAAGFETYNKVDQSYVEEIFSDTAPYQRRITSNPSMLTETLDGGWSVTYNEDGGDESISITKKKIQLKSSDDVSITIEGKRITLRMETSELVMTPDGLTYNGQPLAFASLVDLIVENSSTFVQGVPPGSPAPLFPGTLAKFNSQAPLPNTNAKALKTKV